MRREEEAVESKRLLGGQKSHGVAPGVGGGGLDELFDELSDEGAEISGQFCLF